MNCVKCGREIPEDQVFCELCLTEMEGYPVKPGTAVQIPARAPEEAPRKPVKRKHIPTAEELLLKTRKKLRRTRIFVVILLLICSGLSFLVAQAALELDFQRLLGQNYRTEEGSAATKPASGWTQLVTLPTESAAEEPAVAAEEPSDIAVEAAPQPAPAPVAPPEETPTAMPTVPPTEAPTVAPTVAPTEVPTEAPTAAPTEAPAEPATEVPTAAPAAAPTESATTPG